MAAKLRYPVIVVDEIAGKICRDCSTFKPLSKFGKQADCSGGRKSQCTTCEGRSNYARYKKRAIASVRKYQDANPDKIRLIRRACSKRRHGKIVSGPGITTAQLRALWAAHDHKCAYCTLPAETNDHMIPLSRGGAHDISNIVPACRSCNFRKHTKMPEEFSSSKES